MKEINDLPERPYWPEYYLRLEEEYTREANSLFYNLSDGEAKEWARLEVLQMRVDFKRMWNLTHHVKFYE